ncbi:MAG TPA: OmpH family outer membrane protein [Pseudodesulfovibrio sp.]|nr:OmpH family outer membrane protein [Pseudodesulfovibrio sp.]
MRRFSVAFLALALVAAPAAMAAGNKVGLIDMQKLLAQSTAGQEVRQELKGFGTQLQAKMNSTQDKLKKEQQELQKNAKIETEAQQKKAQDTFKSHVQAYQQQAHQAQQSFQQKRASLMVPLQAKLEDVVSAYAKQHGYDLIIDSQAVVYNAPGLDVADAIVKAFNKAQPHAPPPDTSATPAELSGSGGR